MNPNGIKSVLKKTGGGEFHLEEMEAEIGVMCSENKGRGHRPRKTGTRDQKRQGFSLAASERCTALLAP